MTLEEILLKLRVGDMSCMTNEAVQLMNDKAIGIISADSTLSLTQQDVDDLDMLIEISNLLYNNTTLNMLPLDDGIYDMLMIIVKRYNPNYQVGARPVSFESRAEASSNTILDPFVVRDSRLNGNLYGNDFQSINWKYMKPNPLEINGKASKRTRDTAHNYPELVGTLDKCKFVLSDDALKRGMYNASNVEILQRDFFERHINMGLYGPNTPITVIAELKYDGISIEADVSNKILGARTRGDTNNDKAYDFTPVLYGYEFPNSYVKDDEVFGMKFEAILTNAALRELNYSYGKSYKNARNAVQGLLSGEDGRRWRDFITLVPLSASIAPANNMNRAEEINFLNTYYFNREDKLYYQIMQGNYVTVLYQIREFMKAAEYARDSMPFLYDGIVISYMDPYIINALGRQNSVNKWQMAVKFEAMRKDTVFLGYRYTVGKNGVITPMIYYKPIEFYGCIHNHSSGHSFARFENLQLKCGDIITVEYTNDVMPYVIGKTDCEENRMNTNPVVQFPTLCPFCGAPVLFTEKSASCSNPGCPERGIARATNMLEKLDFKGFSEATVRKLGIRSLSDLITIPLSNVMEVLKEKTTANFNEQRQKLLNNKIFDYKIIGSLGFQDIAEITWQLILAHIHIQDIIFQDNTTLSKKLEEIRGIGERTINTILNERSVYKNDLSFIMRMPNVVSTFGSESKVQIRFTGVRDRELMESLANAGYDCREGGVTKHTKILLVPHKGYNSTKVAAAPQDCRIIPIDEFKANPIGIIEAIARSDFDYNFMIP